MGNQAQQERKGGGGGDRNQLIALTNGMPGMIGEQGTPFLIHMAGLGPINMIEQLTFTPYISHLWRLLARIEPLCCSLQNPECYH